MFGVSEKKRDDVIEEVREMVEGHTISDSQRFSLDEIMAEFEYDETLKPGSRKKRRQREKAEREAERMNDDTIALRNLAEQMRELVRAEQEAAPAPPPSAPALPAEPEVPEEITAFLEKTDFSEDRELRVTVTEQIDFGPEGMFGQAFKPSESFVRQKEEELPEEEEQAPPRPTLAARIRRRARRPEKPKPQFSPAQAAEKLAPYVRFFTLRTLIALGVCIPLLYITFSHRYSWPTPDFLTYALRPASYVTAVLFLQILVMVCGVDVLAKGIFDLAHFRPGMETAVCVSCLSNIVYVVTIFFHREWSIFLPYCSVAAVSLLAVMWSHKLRLSAWLRTYKAASQTEIPYAVFREETMWPGGPVITKGEAPLGAFVEQTEKPDGAARFASFFVPILLVASLMFALISSVGQGQPEKFFWAWAAISSAAAPVCAALSFTLPMARAAARLQSVGAAIAGWFGVRAMADEAAVVLTDYDIFPPGTVTLNGLKVFGSYGFERVISYAASVMAASGSGLSRAFSQLLEGQQEAIRRVDEFLHYEGGGMGAEIRGDRVLVGTSSFMLRMGIHLPSSLNLKNAVFVAVNLELAGIFAINYVPAGGVRGALIMLLRHRILPLFAVRDINVSPMFLKKKFKMNSDFAEFPTVEDRLMLSDPVRETRAQPVAAVSREGLTPYAECVVAGRRVHKLTKINLVIYLLTTLVGVGLLFFLTLNGEAVTASPCNMLAYFGLTLVPTLLVSGWAKRY